MLFNSAILYLFGHLLRLPASWRMEFIVIHAISTINFDMQIQISKVTYNHILTASDNLKNITITEEIFDFLMENYFEIEMEMLSISQRNLIFGWGSAEISNEKSQLNRRMINFLSTARLYLDHAPSRLGDFFGEKSEQIEAFKAVKSNAYDTKLGFRVLEALRNNSQHHGYPIEFVSMKAAWQRDKPKPLNQYTTDPIIDIRKLEENTRFKKSVLNELAAHEGPIRLKTLLREYMDGLGDIHEDFRERIFENQQSALAEMQIAEHVHKDKYPLEKNSEKRYLILMRFEEPQKYYVDCHIGQRTTRELDFLQTKNRNLHNISTRYVSSETTE